MTRDEIVARNTSAGRIHDPSGLPMVDVGDRTRRKCGDPLPDGLAADDPAQTTQKDAAAEVHALQKSLGPDEEFTEDEE